MSSGINLYIYEKKKSSTNFKENHANGGVLNLEQLKFIWRNSADDKKKITTTIGQPLLSFKY